MEQPATNNCPPHDAEPPSGLYFRCCKNSPVAASDMETVEEQNRLLNADACKRKALSVFTSLDDAKHQALLFRGWKRRYVASGALEGIHGVAKPTSGQQPSHTSWWPAANLNPNHRADLFLEVELAQ